MWKTLVHSEWGIGAMADTAFTESLALEDAHWPHRALVLKA